MNMNSHTWRGGRNNGISVRRQLRSADDAFDMGAGDTEPNECHKYTVGRKQGIRCRLLLKKYRNREAAEKRCMEIHGRKFDGLFKSGRYWVFWEWEKRQCIF